MAMAMAFSLTIMVLMLSALPARSDVYKCPDGKGGMRFQDAPCTGSDETPLVITVPTAPVYRPSLPPPPEQASASFTPPKDPLLADFVKALRKLNAATEVGVTKIEYGKLVIEAQAAANDALPNLPAGDLRRALKAAMDLHTDALQSWDAWFRMRLPGHPSSLSENWINAERHVKRAIALMQQPAVP